MMAALLGTIVQVRPKDRPSAPPRDATPIRYKEKPKVKRARLLQRLAAGEPRQTVAETEGLTLRQLAAIVYHYGHRIRLTAGCRATVREMREHGHSDAFICREMRITRQQLQEMDR
jgi:hypothetical protein